MKHFTCKSALIVLFCLLIVSSCEKEELKPEIGDVTVTNTFNALIGNYGSFGLSNGSITALNSETDTVINNLYEVSNGIALSSNVQHLKVYNNNAYLVCNEGDKISVADMEKFGKITNIREEIVKPRFISFKDTIAFVSCWGPEIEFQVLEDSYIAKINLNTNEVYETIELDGGPEGLEIVGDKLYAALNYVDSIAVINLNNNDISYIAAPAVSSYFLKDNDNNLYVSLVSTWSDFSITPGIGYINTVNDELVYSVVKDGITSSYGSIMTFNEDESQIYILASSGSMVDGAWVEQGAVHLFNTAGKEFESETFVDGSGIKGVSINPATGNIYLLKSGETNGFVEIYSKDKEILKTLQTGINPGCVEFLN